MTKIFFLGFMIIFFFGAGWVFSGSKDTKPEGEKLYKRKCRQCHLLISPKKYTDYEWEEFLEHYAKEAKLTKSEKEKILEFLAIHSKKN